MANIPLIRRTELGRSARAAAPCADTFRNTFSVHVSGDRPEEQGSSSVSARRGTGGREAGTNQLLTEMLTPILNRFSVVSPPNPCTDKLCIRISFVHLQLDELRER